MQNHRKEENMNLKLQLTLAFIVGLFCFSQAQTVTTTQMENFEVSSTTAKFLGKTKAVRDLPLIPSTSKDKKAAAKRMKKVPANFKGRKPGGKSTNMDLVHQGPDPIRQLNFDRSPARSLSRGGLLNEPLVNNNGLSNGSSPHDPTGDVSDEFFVQSINSTTVGVFDLNGGLVQSFAMNTLWADLNESSLGDPIILYDENEERWFITEFTGPAKLLVAVSDNKDPLGSYSAYSFATPNFPDYPKYAITPEALVVTTNEQGAGTLHQYFLDIEALYAGAANVDLIRVSLGGNFDTEAGFYVSTPADWNGTNMPFDNRPITLAINDSSWNGGPAEDQVEIYTFNLDFDTPNNTTVEQTAIVITPFDSYPCSATGPGFHCVPQLGGGGLDAIPEVIMNIPHLRNFGTHESLVFNFITDATDGLNLSAIRWVELRRTATTDWALYQEGTFAPNDDLDRFMGSIAIDDNGTIGMAYNVSSPDTYVGIRYTGRFDTDPLGVMTMPETTVINGGSTINSSGRFGDYSQLSVSPEGDNTFWFTTEFAAGNGSNTRIVAFQYSKDSFDLSLEAITEPISADDLTATELVTARIKNKGLNSMVDFEVGLLLDGTPIQTLTITDPLEANTEMNYQFTTSVDLSVIGDYELSTFVNHPADQNSMNDTLVMTISKVIAFDGAVEASVPTFGCADSAPAEITLINGGGQPITSAMIDVTVNGTFVETVPYTGDIPVNGSDIIEYDVTENLQLGNNNIDFAITMINGSADNNTANNTATVIFDRMEDDQFVTLLFRTDNSPQESNWVITDADTGEEIISGTLFGQSSNTLYTQQICMTLDACYILTVTDTQGDGLSGQGFFQIVDNEGNILIDNDGNYSSSVSEEFCPGQGCTLSATISVENASDNNVADGRILVTNPTGGVAPFLFSNDGGATTQSNGLFQNLLPDTYEIWLSVPINDCIFSETVAVGSATGVYNINNEEVIVSILPNPTEGVFKVIISNLQINDPMLKLEIIDVTGRILQERTVSKYDNDYIGTLSLYDYPNGHYFMRVVNKEVNILERIVKMN
ncbi:MAG: hypothetical protein ACJATF_002086 [Flavobacteriales bacterium]